MLYEIGGDPGDEKHNLHHFKEDGLFCRKGNREYSGDGDRKGDRK